MRISRWHILALLFSAGSSCESDEWMGVKVCIRNVWPTSIRLCSGSIPLLHSSTVRSRVHLEKWKSSFAAVLRVWSISSIIDLALAISSGSATSLSSASFRHSSRREKSAKLAPANEFSMTSVISVTADRSAPVALRSPRILFASARSASGVPAATAASIALSMIVVSSDSSALARSPISDAVCSRFAMCICAREICASATPASRAASAASLIASRSFDSSASSSFFWAVFRAPILLRTAVTWKSSGPWYPMSSACLMAFSSTVRSSH
mmetsp:Transcript_96724/g.276174  ORF Transcript_96724/g.276174 Transcript_96724/m.276174 type:complete len:268 (+) Transcript_96724:226-1029(+)